MGDIPLDDLLRCAMQIIARIAMRPEQVGKIVMLNGTAKQLKAYNLCDGTMTQSDVARKAGIDGGNFSRTAARWVDSGVLFKTGTGKNAKLLHVYPLLKSDIESLGSRRVPRRGKAARARKRGRQRSRR